MTTAILTATPLEKLEQIVEQCDNKGKLAIATLALLQREELAAASEPWTVGYRVELALEDIAQIDTGLNAATILIKKLSESEKLQLASAILTNIESPIPF